MPTKSSCSRIKSGSRRMSVWFFLVTTSSCVRRMACLVQVVWDLVFFACYQRAHFKSRNRSVQPMKPALFGGLPRTTRGSVRMVRDSHELRSLTMSSGQLCFLYRSRMFAFRLCIWISAFTRGCSRPCWQTCGPSTCYWRNSWGAWERLQATARFSPTLQTLQLNWQIRPGNREKHKQKWISYSHR